MIFAYSLVSIGDRWLPPSRSDIQTAPEQFQQCMQSTGKDTSEHSFAVQEAKEYAQRSKKRITVQYVVGWKRTSCGLGDEVTSETSVVRCQVDQI